MKVRNYLVQIVHDESTKLLIEEADLRMIIRSRVNKVLDCAFQGHSPIVTVIEKERAELERGFHVARL